VTLSCRSSRTQYSSVGKTCFHVFSHHTWWSSCPLSAALSSRGFRLSWQLTICRTSFINCKHANTHINFQPNTSAISLFGWVFRWDHRLRPKLIWRPIFGLSPELRLMNFTECKLSLTHSLVNGWHRQLTFRCLFTFGLVKKWIYFRQAKQPQILILHAK